MKFIFSRKSRRIVELERQVKSLTEEAESLRSRLVDKPRDDRWDGIEARLKSKNGLDRQQTLFGPRYEAYYSDTLEIRAALYSGYIGPVCSNEDLDLASRVLRNLLPVKVGWSLDSASKPITEGVYCRLDDRNFSRPVVLWDSRNEAQGSGIPITRFDRLKKTFIEADKAINNTP
jgi:hypothetical protein